VSIAQVGNDASERIMAKLGMRLERGTIDPTCGRPVRVRAITKRTTHINEPARANQRPGRAIGGPLTLVSQGL
jgi:hypothetical protein